MPHLLWPKQNRLVLEEDGGCCQEDEVLARNKLKEPVAGSVGTAKRSDDDGCIKNETHVRRVTFISLPWIGKTPEMAREFALLDIAPVLAGAYVGDDGDAEVCDGFHFVFDEGLHFLDFFGGDVEEEFVVDLEGHS